MPHPFDPGYVKEPFPSLVRAYPEADAYPANRFRLEWGPIFHRGRLDGSARVLVIGQDPAQHEAIVRRVLVGEAGRRLQGFLAKLGLTESYAIINTFVYSVYGSVSAQAKRHPKLVAFRNRWLDALLVRSQVEAVVALGTMAREAFETWKATPAGAGFAVVFVPITHPTQPESAAQGNAARLATETKKLLRNWNLALGILRPAVAHPDLAGPFVPYGTTWAAGERPPIPERDFPAGLPTWMHQQDGWARRVGRDAREKRRTITVTVPKGIVA